MEWKSTTIVFIYNTIKLFVSYDRSIRTLHQLLADWSDWGSGTNAHTCPGRRHSYADFIYSEFEYNESNLALAIVPPYIIWCTKKCYRRLSLNYFQLSIFFKTDDMVSAIGTSFTTDVIQQQDMSKNLGHTALYIA